MLVTELWWMLAYPVFIYIGYRKARPKWTLDDNWCLAGILVTSPFAFFILWVLVSGLLLPSNEYDLQYFVGMSKGLPWLPFLGVAFLTIFQYLLPAVLGALFSTRVLVMTERHIESSIALFILVWGLSYVLMLGIAMGWLYFHEN